MRVSTMLHRFGRVSQVIGFSVLLGSLVVPALAATVISGGPANDYESWIERLHDGRIMVVFARNPDWVSGDLYVTFSTDDGQNWSAPAPIIVRDGDQATLSFVQMPSDTLRLFFASNETGLYKIRSAWSLDRLAWTDEGILDFGWSASQQYYDPTVELEPDGSLTMSYVAMGSGVYVAHCPAGGHWDTARTQVSSSGNRPRVMKHSDGTYVYAYHMRVGTQTQYDIFVRQSDDLVNWSAPVRITTNLNSHDPFVCEVADGSLLITYAKHTGVAYNLYRRTSPDGVTWSDESAITDEATNNTQPHILAEGQRLFLAYAHAVSYPTDHDVYLETLSDVSAVSQDWGQEGEGEPTPTGSAGVAGLSRLTASPIPFHDATRLTYFLHEPREVTLELFDVHGRRVRSTVVRHQDIGQHTIVLDASAEAAGVYLCRLRAGGSALTVRLPKIR